MTNTSPTDEAGSTPVPDAQVASGETKEAPRGFLKVARRNLNEQELAHPAALRFMVAEIERLDTYFAETKGIVDEYHRQRVTIATLTEAAKPANALKILSAATLAIGSAGLGAAPNYMVLQGGLAAGLIVLALSGFLVLAAIVAMVRQ